MKVYTQLNFKEYNSFGLPVLANTAVACETEADIMEFLAKHGTQYLVLGGGSNILFTRNVEEPVLLMRLQGIKILKESDDSIVLEVMAGENWHNFVLHCVQNGWGGLENLSLIPGTVGAAPMQNIGAYGVEVKDTILAVNAINRNTGQKRVFTNAECNFGYRESIFKTREKGNYIITSVVFLLTKSGGINTSYGAITTELEKLGIINPTIQDVSNAVIRIRQSKLPNPKEIGNAGSFFKNPVLPTTIATNIQQQFPELPIYHQPNNLVKIPAAWLIEQCGWKGYRQGDAGVHEKHALVLVNYGTATGREILHISSQIILSVENKFGITLEREVNIY